MFWSQPEAHLHAQFLKLKPSCGVGLSTNLELLMVRSSTVGLVMSPQLAHQGLDFMPLDERVV